ncbi:GTPase [candidate division TA06 bacterium]|nr:GTPase [candidate division TA06 bacterium]
MHRRVLIMGAGGREFHNFNTYFRGKEEFEVLAFTAAQIPNISDRRYPRELAGPLYPQGIPIYPESELSELIQKKKIDVVVFAYSDVPHSTVMHKASKALSAGADYLLMGPHSCMLSSKKPVTAICAVRTGAGKSQTTRRVSKILKKKGKKVVVVRHPMPYGDLKKQVCQRFASLEDLNKYSMSIEEREEYEPHLLAGTVVYAGVDYQKILKKAEKEAEVILWDGGNNDFPFFKPDLLIVVADALRPGHERRYHPGETVLRMADVVVINKVEMASREDVSTVRKNIQEMNPKATVIEAHSPIFVENESLIRGKKVLVVEDGPTLTHGGMSYGAGVVAARKYGAEEILDPRPYAVGSIQKIFEEYPHTGALLPAMGYGDEQLKELKETIRKTPFETLIIATPVDLVKVLGLSKPSVRVRYELEEVGNPDLEAVLGDFLKKI